MNNKCAINEFRKDLKKIQDKLSNRTILFILIGIIISILTLIFLVSKIKNKNLLYDDDFYYDYDDDDDFFEDYHALDYEEDEE